MWRESRNLGLVFFQVLDLEGTSVLVLLHWDGSGELAVVIPDIGGASAVKELLLLGPRSDSGLGKDFLEVKGVLPGVHLAEDLL